MFNPGRKNVACAAIYLVAWFLSSDASAHTLHRSYADLKVEKDAVHGQLDIHPGDLDETMRSRFDTDRSGNITYDEIQAQKKQLAALSLSGFRVFRNDLPCTPELKKTKTSPASKTLRLHIRFSCPPGEHLRVDMPLLERMSSKHAHFLTIKDGQHFIATTLSKKNRTWETPDTKTHLKQAWGFFVLGFEHILVGYDHLLFLLALLLVSTRFKGLLAIITAFTLAHSITLALAYFKLVELPAQIVEASIALSIVYIAIENCLVQAPQKRWLMTFILGLVHGLGFAGVLRGVNLPSSSRSLSLAAFNLGVEAGQILVVLAVLPLLWWLQKKAPQNTTLSTAQRKQNAFNLGYRLLIFGAITILCWQFHRATGIALLLLVPILFILHFKLGFRNGVRIGGSLLIAALGLFWFIERLFLAA